MARRTVKPGDVVFDGVEIRVVEGVAPSDTTETVVTYVGAGWAYICDVPPVLGPGPLRDLHTAYVRHPVDTSDVDGWNALRLAILDVVATAERRLEDGRAELARERAAAEQAQHDLRTAVALARGADRARRDVARAVADGNDSWRDEALADLREALAAISRHATA